ncbi:MAG TPA: MBOAT family protein, partial [Chloroflexia bacterium]|nr:MBOAT family protein [Chloroflexia bacterium]
MLFNSIYYAFFLPIVLVLYWTVPRRLRYPLLLIASYLFYMNWIPAYLGLILGLTVVNYGFGIWLGHHRHRGILGLAVATNLGVLVYFKYANFLLDSARSAGLDYPTAQILLPLGISFFTFEFIHYVVDVWRGDPPVRDPVQFALFAAFFPTQIAGPIKRYQAFVHQLEAYPRFDAALAQEGVGLILRGLFKKVVLADALAQFANRGFDQPAALGSVDAWIAVYAFAFQIFFDFSGYTDIGRGSAQLFGFTVPENFAAPYLSPNLASFWRRWHMSLSSWLRDYLFIPLGGSRVSRLATYRNLWLTMTLGGLWHGAAWHFVAWGAYQGVGLVALRWMGDRGAAPAMGPPLPGPDDARPARLRRMRLSLRSALGVAATFHFICLGWVLFRAENLGVVGTLAVRLL